MYLPPACFQCRRFRKILVPNLRDLLLFLLVAAVPFSAAAASPVSSPQPSRTIPNDRTERPAPVPAEAGKANSIPQREDAEPTTRPIRPLPPPAIQQSMPSFGQFKARFNSYDIPLANKLLGMWDETMARHDPEKVFSSKQQYMKSTTAMQWRNITGQMPSMPPDKKLRIINGFFNNFRSRSDQENYGAQEYWAAPVEFLQKGSGDCEDYAIIKYLALRYFSWPAENLWVVLVTDNQTKGQHAVLLARFGTTIFVLDNLSKPKYLLVPASNYMTRYTPYFAVNELGSWLFIIPDAVAKKKQKQARTGRQGKTSQPSGQ